MVTVSAVIAPVCMDSAAVCVLAWCPAALGGWAGLELVTFTSFFRAVKTPTLYAVKEASLPSDMQWSHEQQRNPSCTYLIVEPGLKPALNVRSLIRPLVKLYKGQVQLRFSEAILVFPTKW